MLTHVVVSNMTYADEAAFSKRLAWYKAEVLPRLFAQTDRSFDIAIQCNPAHIDRVKEISCAVIPFTNRNWDKPRGGERIFMPSRIPKFTRWEDVVGLGKYDIQSNLDSDDFISPEYIQRVKEEVMKSDLSKPLHIHFQPEVIDTRTKTTKKMRHKYGKRSGSAFYSIYQPNTNDYIFVRDGSHIHMPMKFEKSVLVPEGYCWIVCNEDNYKTSYKGL